VYEENIKHFGTLTCYLCLKPIKFKQDSLEHKIPLSRGGTNEYCNLAIAHQNCNKKKFTKTESEYREVLKKCIL
jgi:5-methylcytosine-specific restriction endonuclease McrA